MNNTTWSQVFNDVDPYLWAYLGTGLAISFSIVGAAWYERGSTVIGASSLPARQSSAPVSSSLASNLRTLSGREFERGSSVIFCEAVAIYGVIMAIILMGKISYPNGWEQYITHKEQNMRPYEIAQFGGYCIFMSGMSVGLCNLFCG